ncbi:hypothetical protein JYZ04_002619 [Salmonella enterica subsp. enterica serovar Oranienburg]|nr:hypothetical protein [Salmonella enterica subsp. enterica serovar Oranienburg]
MQNVTQTSAKPFAALHKLLELQQKENDGLLMLDKLSEHGINGLIRRQ